MNAGRGPGEIARTTLALLALCAASPVRSEPLVKIAIRYYEVTGHSAGELRAQLDRLGPIGSDGRRYDGRTDWDARWSYSYSDSAAGCRIDRVTVSANITYTMPSWNGADSAPQPLREHWRGYLAALRRHEEGHRDLALEAARAIERGIREMPQTLLCQALPAALDALGQRTVEQHKKLDAEYDARTGHGTTQGAVFP